VAAVSLAASMLFSALYGSRFFLPLSWLDLPWMRALHGTANALGFGLVGVVAWSAAGPSCRPGALALDEGFGQHLLVHPDDAEADQPEEQRPAPRHDT
jgi:hypothetical protein